MPLRKALFLLCAAGSTACIAAAYGMTECWWGAGLVVLPCVFPLVNRRIPGRWVPHAYLWSMLCAAAIGVVAGAPARLVLPGAVLALAAWDLVNRDRAGAGSGRERKHARSLALALGLGLLLAEGGMMVSLPIPFPLMLLCVILAVFSLNRVFRLLTMDSRQISGPPRR